MRCTSALAIFVPFFRQYSPTHHRDTVRRCFHRPLCEHLEDRLCPATPIAVDDFQLIADDGSAIIDVLANDTDEGGTLDPTTVSIVQFPTYGTVEIDPITGVVTYQHASFDIDQNGQVLPLSDGVLIMRSLFGFTGDALTNGAVDPEGARTDPGEIEGYLNSITNPLLDIDGNGQFLALSDGLVMMRYIFGFTGSNLTTGAVDPNGTRTDPDEVSTYIQQTNFTAPDSDEFTYTFRDVDSTESNEGVVTLSRNAPPVANDDQATTVANQAVVIDVLANDSDPDGTLEPASVTIVLPPSNGTVVVDSVTGQVTYTPSTDFTGQDSFTYIVLDNQGEVSNEATVTIQVQSAPISAGPTQLVSRDRSATTAENESSKYVDPLAELLRGARQGKMQPDFEARDPAGSLL